MAIGPVGAGKSTLLRALDLCGDAPDSVRKTQNVEYHAEAVDTPGEAFEIPYLYHMLITSSTRASLILLLADPTRKIAIDRTTGTAERKRAVAMTQFPQFEAARERGKRIKDHVLASIGRFESQQK